MTKKTIMLSLISLMIGLNFANAQYMRMRGNSNIGGYFFASKEGQGIRADYSKYLSPTFVVSPALFYEFGNPMQSKYRNVGADLMFAVIPIDMGQKFAIFAKAGITGQFESLTGLSEDVSGFSAGGKGGLELEYNVSQSLAFSAFGYQAYLLKKTFGNSYYHVGVGFKINLYSY